MSEVRFDGADAHFVVGEFLVPVNLSQCVDLDGIADPLPLGALDAALAAGAQLIDVRFAELYAAGHLRGAKNIPLGKLRERIGELDKNAEYLLYCMIGQKSYYAERILKQHGFRVRTLACGYHMLKELFPERITAE